MVMKPGVQIDSTRASSPVLELSPIVNSPYQSETLTIYPRDIKWVLAYKYMYRNRGVRIVTHQLDDHLIILKD